MQTDQPRPRPASPAERLALADHIGGHEPRRVREAIAVEQDANAARRVANLHR